MDSTDEAAKAFQHKLDKNANFLKMLDRDMVALNLTETHETVEK